MRMRAAVVLVAAGVCGCRPAPTPDPADDLLALVRRRLDLIPDVARWKWTHKAAVSDPARESAFLGEMADAGTAHGLEPADTARFFAAQIDAAKVLQQAAFDRWAAAGQPPFLDVPDLKLSVRPRIDRVSRDMLPALAAVRRHPPTPDAVRWAAERHLGGLPDGVRATAVAPLLAGP